MFRSEMFRSDKKKKHLIPSHKTSGFPPCATHVNEGRCHECVSVFIQDRTGQEGPQRQHRRLSELAGNSVGKRHEWNRVHWHFGRSGGWPTKGSSQRFHEYKSQHNDIILEWQFHERMTMIINRTHPRLEDIYISGLWCFHLDIPFSELHNNIC